MHERRPNASSTVYYVLHSPATVVYSQQQISARTYCSLGLVPLISAPCLFNFQILDIVERLGGCLAEWSFGLLAIPIVEEEGKEKKKKK